VSASALPFGDHWLEGRLEDAEFSASTIVYSRVSEATTYHRLGVTLLQNTFASKVFVGVMVDVGTARVEFRLRTSAFVKVTAILDVQGMRAVVEASSNLCLRHLMKNSTSPRGLPSSALLVRFHSH
jgi:hypothetical protein